jgi:hypothetical protein
MPLSSLQYVNILRGFHLTLMNRNLNPGGWIEIHDMKFPIEDNDNSFPEDCAVRKWTDFVLEAASNLGRPLDSAKNYKQQLIDAGFENVTQVMYKWPQNHWTKDKKLKELGKLFAATAW